MKRCALFALLLALPLSAFADTSRYINPRRVIGASAFYHGEILGHVLQAETDALFRNRKRS